MPPERRAVALLLGLAVAGQGLRTWALAPDAPPGEIRLPGAVVPGAAGRHRDSSRTGGQPLLPGETVDLDQASAAEIARIPGVGPALARAIVADREALGPFGGLEGLDQVRGVGPGLLARIAPSARFSGAPRAQGRVEEGAEGWAFIGGVGEGRLDLNSAPAEALERLPHIGPSLAARIVASRERDGPFPSVDSLVRIPGIGPATLARVRDRLRVE